MANGILTFLKDLIIKEGGTTTEIVQKLFNCLPIPEKVNLVTVTLAQQECPRQLPMAGLQI